jgi:protein arginine kinase activator
MLCDNCKERDSVVKLVQITIEGTPRELRLCEKCAAEKGVETTVVATPPQLGELLQKVQQQLMAGGGSVILAGAPGSGAPGMAGSTTRDAARCTFCSATLGDFRSTGRLGCAHCYGAFETSLRELLRRVHGSARHTGRKYEPPQPDEIERAGTLGELRDRLKRAIDAEQFELAADIRDRIRVLE